jgi:hypothetical protein
MGILSCAMAPAQWPRLHFAEIAIILSVINGDVSIGWEIRTLDQGVRVPALFSAGIAA